LSGITVCALQLRAHDRASLRGAWPLIRRQFEEALAKGAQLVVMPEATLPGYVLGYEPFEAAEVEAQVRQCQELARGANAVVVIGSARREGTRVMNSAVIIDADGEIAGYADKHFLWHFDRQWFAPGESIRPVRTKLGNVGALVCADGRIPTIARTLVDRGAQILVMPTAWVTSGRDAQDLENVQADLLARVRARENAVPFVAANKCGVELQSVAYCGKSQIIGADGGVLALASQNRAETIEATIELPVPRGARALPPLARGTRREGTVRIAISAETSIENAAQVLRILEAGELINASFACAVGDEQILDPGALAATRLQGGSLAVWRTDYDPQWQVTFARARALELRMYVIVLDTARRRAYAIDPDGAIVCGTFGDYRVAAFTFDAARTASTMVAPGTDVLAGLERAAAHAGP
jgi:N-carbamoylputrescine amidase